MKLYLVSMKGQKGNRPCGKSRKSDLDGRARFRYGNKYSPQCGKNYGTRYTDRQLMILSGEIPWETTPLNQITLLVNKAESLGDVENYEKAKHLQQLKRKQGEYKPEMTHEEALAVLRSLTPWNTDP